MNVQAVMLPTTTAWLNIEIKCTKKYPERIVQNYAISIFKYFKFPVKTNKEIDKLKQFISYILHHNVKTFEKIKHDKNKRDKISNDITR